MIARVIAGLAVALTAAACTASPPAAPVVEEAAAVGPTYVEGYLTRLSLPPVSGPKTWQEMVFSEAAR